MFTTLRTEMKMRQLLTAREYLFFFSPPHPLRGDLPLGRRRAGGSRQQRGRQGPERVQAHLRDGLQLITNEF